MIFKKIKNKLKGIKIRRTRGDRKKYTHVIQGSLSIIDGFVRIITLGYFWSNLEYIYAIKSLGGKKRK